MVLQEISPEICYRAGRQNGNADALSGAPLSDASADLVHHLTAQQGDADNSIVREEDDHEEVDSFVSIEGEMATEQRKDPHLTDIITFIESGTLPDDPARAKRITLERPRFGLVDGVLYFCDTRPPYRMRIAVPTQLQSLLLAEAHSGRFAGHFAEKALFKVLEKRFWWDGMRADVRTQYKSCLPCATRTGPGRKTQPPLQPIPVGSPFQRVAVDVLQLPQTQNGNKYAVVFMDYLTKWPEVFATSDQSAETIAKLLVEHIICRHGVPEELLSDQGPNFMSDLIREICQFVGMKKINTRAYHPQTDGMVEKFNSTLIAMIAKQAAVYGSEWDRYLCYLLFAYRVKCHDSTQESPFFLLYGRDARIPIEAGLTQPRRMSQVDVDDYKVEMLEGFATAWTTAQLNMQEAQHRYKKQFDKTARQVAYHPGDRVFVFMPQETTGRNRKLARPYYGPYRVVSSSNSGLKVVPVDRPAQDPISVHADRVRPCHPEIGNKTWLGTPAIYQDPALFFVQGKSGTVLKNHVHKIAQRTVFRVITLKVSTSNTHVGA